MVVQPPARGWPSTHRQQLSVHAGPLVAQVGIFSRQAVLAELLFEVVEIVLIPRHLRRTTPVSVS